MPGTNSKRKVITLEMWYLRAKLGKYPKWNVGVVGVCGKHVFYKE